MRTAIRKQWFDKFRYWIGVGLTFLIFATDVIANTDLAEPRPFRMVLMQLNPELDRTKPLAMIDGAGWVVNSGILIGAFDHRWVGGIRLPSKKPIWWYDGVHPMTAPPGSFGSWVVLGFRDGTIAKVEALTGKRVWSASLGSFSEREFLLHGTNLFVVTAAQFLYSIDFQSGKTKWLFDAGFPDDLAIRGGAKPVIHDNKVILGIGSGEVLSVNIDTGKLVWRYNPVYNDARFHDVVGEMVVRNNQLVLSRYDGLVAAINLGTNERQLDWQEQLNGVTTSQFHNGRYYVGTVSGDVYALNADNGRRLWRVVTGASVSSITAGETQLFIAGSNGRITAIEAASGAIQWHDDIGGELSAKPILRDDAIFYATGLKNIYGYKLR